MSYIFLKIEYEKQFELVFRFSVLAFVGVKVCSGNFCQCKINDNMRCGVKPPSQAGLRVHPRSLRLTKMCKNDHTRRVQKY